MPDQSQHASLYCGTQPPPALKGEDALNLKPIKMTVEHPSTVLSTTSRIYYKAAYEVLHSCSVKPLGIIDVESIQYLLSDFKAICVPAPETSDLPSTRIMDHDGGRRKVTLAHHEGTVQMCISSGVQSVDSHTLDELQQSIAQVAGFDDLERSVNSPPSDAFRFV